VAYLIVSKIFLYEFPELIQEVGQREELITRILPPFITNLKDSPNPNDPYSTPGKHYER